MAGNTNSSVGTLSIDYILSSWDAGQCPSTHPCLKFQAKGKRSWNLSQQGSQSLLSRREPLLTEV